MEINITPLNGNSFNLHVSPMDTVGSLKTLIQQELGYAPESQKLTFVNGQMVTLDDNTWPISSYGLHPDCQVSLLVTQPIQVFLRRDGKSKCYDIEPEETVSNFRRKVEKRENVPNAQFRLVHEGKDMNEGNLSDYNVRANSTIYMLLRLRGG